MNDYISPGLGQNIHVWLKSEQHKISTLKMAKWEYRKKLIVSWPCWNDEITSSGVVLPLDILLYWISTSPFSATLSFLKHQISYRAIFFLNLAKFRNNILEKLGKTDRHVSPMLQITTGLLKHISYIVGALKMCVPYDLVTSPLGICPWSLIQKKTKSCAYRDGQYRIIYKSKK